MDTLNAESFLQWTSKYDDTNAISAQLSATIFGYLEGHDYSLCCDDDGNLFMLDIATEDGDMDATSIPALLICIYNWNYELIQETQKVLKDCSSMERLAAKTYLRSLQADSALLDAALGIIQLRAECV